MANYRNLAIGVAAAFSLALIMACSSTTTPSGGSGCQSGATQACTCVSGESGVAQCAGGSFGACQCGASGDAGDAGAQGDSGNPADTDAGHDGGASTSDAGFGQYMGPCNMTTDCPPGDICYLFSSKGMFCTKTCTTTAECPAPSPKCTPKGYCSVPD